jgi:hypothetical protein
MRMRQEGKRMWMTRCLRPQRGPGKWRAGRGKWLLLPTDPAAELGSKKLG